MSQPVRFWVPPRPMQLRRYCASWCTYITVSPLSEKMRRRHRMSQRRHYTSAAYFRPKTSTKQHNGISVTLIRFWATRFSGSRREKRPPSRPEAFRICWYRIDPHQSGPAPPAMHWQATTCGGSPHPPAGGTRRPDMTQEYCAGNVREKGRKTCTKQHNGISVTLIRSLGRPRAGAVQSVDFGGERAQ